MATIPLSRGMEALVDDDDFERLSVFNWSAAKTRSYFYAITMVARGDCSRWMLYMHRFLMFGLDSSDLFVDHINGYGLDNRKTNLRVCTNRENQQNQRKIRGRSMYKGVSLEGKKWKVTIRVNGDRIRIGGFLTEEDAAKAYDDLARKYYGEFAFTNFTDEAPNAKARAYARRVAGGV